MASARCSPVARALASPGAASGAAVRFGVGVAGTAAAVPELCVGAAGGAGVELCAGAGVAGTADEEASGAGVGLGCVECSQLRSTAGVDGYSHLLCSRRKPRNPFPQYCRFPRCHHPLEFCLKHKVSRQLMPKAGHGNSLHTAVDQLLELRIPTPLFRNPLLDSRNLSSVSIQLENVGPKL